MAITVAGKNYQSIDTCESITPWTGNKVALVGDYFKQGSNSVGFTFTTAGNNDAYVTGSWNLTGKPHIRMWFMTVVLKEMETYDNGGLQVFVTGGGYTGYWKMLGKATYPGGWYNLVVDASSQPDTGDAPTLGSVTAVGIRMVIVGTPKNAQNTWVDSVMACDGLICTNTAPQITLEDIYGYDNDPATGGWGVIRKIGGVYYLAGNLTLGDATGALLCDFKDTSQVVVFENRRVASTLYGIEAVNASGTCKVQLGDKSGTAGISGCAVRTQISTQTPKFNITCTDTDVSDFKLYGSTFFDAGTISLPLTGTNREVIGCNFEKVASLLPQTIVIDSSNFISYGARSLGTSSITNSNWIAGTGLITMGGGVFTDCNVTACTVGVAMLWDIAVDTDGKLDGTIFTSGGTGHAIELGTDCPTSIGFKDMAFSGYGANETTNAAIYNNSGKAIEISLNGTTQPTVKNGSGASTTFPSSITLKMIVTNEAGTGINGVYAYIDDNDQTPYIMNTTTANVDGVDGVAKVTYTGSPVSQARWRARLYGYKNFKQLVDIESVDVTLPVTLVVDPQQT